MDREKNEIVEAKASKRGATKATGIASVSFFIAMFDRLGEVIYNAIVNGFFGRCFSAYTKLQQIFVNSLLGRILFGNHRFRKIFRMIRGYLAKKIESGFFVSKTRDGIKYFYSLPLNAYGGFFLFFGIYTVVVYALKALLPILGTAQWDNLIVGIIVIIVSFPLAFSRVPLITAIKHSSFGKMIFQRAFGISDESFENNFNGNEKKHIGNYMFFCKKVYKTNKR